MTINNNEKIEMDIARRITKSQTDKPNIDINQEIKHEIQKANYTYESWQEEFVIKRILKNINYIRNFENKTENTDNISDIIQSKEKLINVGEIDNKLIFIECKACGIIKEPEKWSVRTAFGILLLFTVFNILGVLLYFVTTNPYICPKCRERNKLVKILNNKQKIPINSMSTTAFSIIWGTVVALGIIYLLWRFY